MDRITTIGDLRKFMKSIEDLPDDFTIDFRVRRKLTEEELIRMRYPYPYNTIYIDGFEFDDIGHSDKVVCFGVTLPEE